MCVGGRSASIRTDLMNTNRQRFSSSFPAVENRIWNERVRGCGGKNVKETGQKMRRRKDGEETEETYS